MSGHDLSRETLAVCQAYRWIREAADEDPAETTHDALWSARVMAAYLEHNMNLGEPNHHIEIPVRQVGCATRSCFPKTAAGEARYQLEFLSVEIDHLKQAVDYITNRMEELKTKNEMLVSIIEAEPEDDNG